MKRKGSLRRVKGIAMGAEEIVIRKEGISMGSEEVALGAEGIAIT